MQLSFLIINLMSISSNNSMVYILSINMTAIMGSMYTSFYLHLSWLSYMIMFLMVGGLMILYIFILSMNSNEMIKSKTNLKMSSIMLIVFTLLMVFKLKPLKSNNQTSKLIYNMNWSLLCFIIMTIILTMFLASKLIFYPSNPSKSMK